MACPTFNSNSSWSLHIIDNGDPGGGDKFCRLEADVDLLSLLLFLILELPSWSRRLLLGVNVCCLPVDWTSDDDDSFIVSGDQQPRFNENPVTSSPHNMKATNKSRLDTTTTWFILLPVYCCCCDFELEFFMLTILYSIRISSIAYSFDFQANTESGNAKLGVYVEHSQ